MDPVLILCPFSAGTDRIYRISGINVTGPRARSVMKSGETDAKSSRYVKSQFRPFKARARDLGAKRGLAVSAHERKG